MEELKYNRLEVSKVLSCVKEEPNYNLEEIMKKFRELRIKLIKDAETEEEVASINQFIAAGVTMAKKKSGQLDHEEINDLVHMFLLKKRKNRKNQNSKLESE